VELGFATLAPQPGAPDVGELSEWANRAHRASTIPGLDYELRPRIHFEREKFDDSGVIVAEHNDLGMRDGPIVWAKAPGVRRIAVLGDSTTYGYGVSQGEDYTSVLEELLDASDPAHDYETLNFGVAGYGTKREAIVLEHKALLLKPDAVVLGYNLNDPDIDHFGDLLFRKYMPPAWWQHFHTTRFLMGRFEKFQIDRVGGGDIFHFWHAPGHANWATVKDGFARIAELAKDANVPVLVVIFTVGDPTASPETYRYRDIHAQVAALATQNGFGVLDLSPVYSALTAKGIESQFPHLHPNLLGQRAAAQAIHDYLCGPNGPFPLN